MLVFGIPQYMFDYDSDSKIEKNGIFLYIYVNFQSKTAFLALNLEKTRMETPNSDIIF